MGDRGKAVAALTEREKQTLRLLLVGHDAKSIARESGLSVHTINERLRDARRKLGVWSSREAARLLAEVEGARPQKCADEPIGVAAALEDAAGTRPQRRAHPLAWLSGGMLIMSLLIAAAIVLLPAHGVRQLQTAPARAAPPAYQAASEQAARSWLALIDAQRWDDSWAATGALARAKIGKVGWANSIRPVRTPLGAVVTRRLQNATRTTTLPGVPAGDYAVLRFATDFAQKPGSMETVILAREGTTMRVVGYFIA